MDGLEATRRIRELESSLNMSNDKPCHQYIVGLSANSDPETIQIATDIGIDYFMEKPFTSANFNKFLKIFKQQL